MSSLRPLRGDECHDNICAVGAAAIDGRASTCGALSEQRRRSRQPRGCFSRRGFCLCFGGASLRGGLTCLGSE